MNPDNIERALELMQGVQNELDLGTKHYNRVGKLLTTQKEVIECLVQEGTVMIVPTPDRVDLFRERQKEQA